MNADPRRPGAARTSLCRTRVSSRLGRVFSILSGRTVKGADTVQANIEYAPFGVAQSGHEDGLTDLTVRGPSSPAPLANRHCESSPLRCECLTSRTHKRK